MFKTTILTLLTLASLSFAGQPRNMIVDKIWYLRQNTGVDTNVTQNSATTPKDDNAGELFFKLNSSKSGAPLSNDGESHVGTYYCIDSEDPSLAEMFSILLTSSMNNYPVEVWYYTDPSDTQRRIVTRLFFWPQGYLTPNGELLPYVSPDIATLP